MIPGPKNLITDVPGLLVGNAHDARLKSGVTVLTRTTPFTASVNIMGGAPGTRETELLAPDKTVAAVDALVLSGGSAFGIDACSGVMHGLREQGRGFRMGPVRVPLAPGAILFDLVNGGEKDWTSSPYPKLGKRALEDASDNFPLGTVGAGTGAMTAVQMGGLGSASFQLDSGTMVGALMAVNPVGSVTTPGGRHFWAAPYEVGHEFGGLGPDPRGGLGVVNENRKAPLIASFGSDHTNTTIGIVATDAPLTKAQCHRLAVAAQDGIARAIVPAHTPSDGDLIFAVATGKDSPVDNVALAEIGHAAALCVSRAIARGIFAARASESDLLPTWQVQNEGALH